MTSVAEKAAQLFRGKEKYNCAQAIYMAFRDRFNITGEQIKDASKQGHGKADGGLCGAVYAVNILIDDPKKSAELHAIFEDRAGSAECKKILKNKTCSCRECVSIAADFLDDSIKEK